MKLLFILWIFAVSVLMRSGKKKVSKRAWAKYDHKDVII